MQRGLQKHVLRCTWKLREIIQKSPRREKYSILKFYLSRWFLQALISQRYCMEIRFLLFRNSRAPADCFPAAAPAMWHVDALRRCRCRPVGASDAGSEICSHAGSCTWCGGACRNYTARRLRSPTRSWQPSPATGVPPVLRILQKRGFHHPLFLRWKR